MRHLFRGTPAPAPRAFPGVCPTQTYTYAERIAVPALYNPETGQHWGLWELPDESVNHRIYVFVN